MILKYKKASFLYDIYDKYEAGLILTGNQVKAIKQNLCSFTDSYISLNPPVLFNLNINSNSTPIKLLLNKKEIIKLQNKLDRGFTIIPLDLHISNGKIKTTIALAKGLKIYDKKQKLKEADILRSIMNNK